MRKLIVRTETWPILGSFNISRVNVTESYAVVVELHEDGFVGIGECEAHEYDASQLEVVANQIEALRSRIERGLTREELNANFPRCAARNAIDCALWDLEAKKAGKRAWELAGVDFSKPILSAYTIGLDPVAVMAEKAKKHAFRPLLKVKLGREGSFDRIEAIRKAAPNARLIVDANEAFTIDSLNELADPFAEMGVELIEQPVPAGQDEELSGYTGSVPLCADESCMDRRSLDSIAHLYDFINIKLDKTGGLTEALALAHEAKTRGLRLMVGCMTGTSLAMAPAMIIGALAEVCDLDGPLLLAKDREKALQFDGSYIAQPDRKLWG